MTKVFFSFLYFFSPILWFWEYNFSFQKFKQKFQNSPTKNRKYPNFLDWHTKKEKKRKRYLEKTLKRIIWEKRRKNPPNSPSSSKKKGLEGSWGSWKSQANSGVEKKILFSSLTCSYIWPTKSNPIHEIAPQNIQLFASKSPRTGLHAKLGRANVDRVIFWTSSWSQVWVNLMGNCVALVFV